MPPFTPSPPSKPMTRCDSLVNQEIPTNIKNAFVIWQDSLSPIDQTSQEFFRLAAICENLDTFFNSQEAKDTSLADLDAFINTTENIERDVASILKKSKYLSKVFKKIDKERNVLLPKDPIGQTKDHGDDQGEPMPEKNETSSGDPRSEREKQIKGTCLIKKRVAVRQYYSTLIVLESEQKLVEKIKDVLRNNFNITDEKVLNKIDSKKSAIKALKKELRNSFKHKAEISSVASIPSNNYDEICTEDARKPVLLVTTESCSELSGIAKNENYLSKIRILAGENNFLQNYHAMLSLEGLREKEQLSLLDAFAEEYCNDIVTKAQQQYAKEKLKKLQPCVIDTPVSAVKSDTLDVFDAESDTSDVSDAESDTSDVSDAESTTSSRFAISRPTSLEIIKEPIVENKIEQSKEFPNNVDRQTFASFIMQAIEYDHHFFYSLSLKEWFRWKHKKDKKTEIDKLNEQKTFSPWIKRKYLDLKIKYFSWISEEKREIDRNDVCLYIQIFFPDRSSDAEHAFKLSQLQSIINTEMSKLSEEKANQIAQRSLDYFKKIENNEKNERGETTYKYMDKITSIRGDLSSKDTIKKHDSRENLQAHLLRKFKKYGARAIISSEALLDPGVLRALSKGQIRLTEIINRNHINPFSNGYHNYGATLRAFGKRFLFSFATFRFKTKQFSMKKARKNLRGDLTGCQKVQHAIFGFFLALGKVTTSAGNDVFLAPAGQAIGWTVYNTTCNVIVAIFTRGKAFFDYLKFDLLKQTPSEKEHGLTYYCGRFLIALVSIVASILYALSNVAGILSLGHAFLLFIGVSPFIPIFIVIPVVAFFIIIAGLSYNSFYIPDLVKKVKEFWQMLKDYPIQVLALTAFFGIIQFGLFLYLMLPFFAFVGLNPVATCIVAGICAAVLTTAGLFSLTASIIRFFIGKEYHGKQADFNHKFEDKTFIQKCNLVCEYFKPFKLAFDSIREAYRTCRNGIWHLIKDIKTENNKDIKKDIFIVIKKTFISPFKACFIFIDQLFGVRKIYGLIKKPFDQLRSIAKSGGIAAILRKEKLTLAVMATVILTSPLISAAYIFDQYFLPSNRFDNFIKAGENIAYQWNDKHGFFNKTLVSIKAPFKMIWATVKTVLSSPLVLTAVMMGDLLAYAVAGSFKVAHGFEKAFHFLFNGTEKEAITIAALVGNVSNSVFFTWTKNIISENLDKNKQHRVNVSLKPVAAIADTTKPESTFKRVLISSSSDRKPDDEIATKKLSLRIKKENEVNMPLIDGKSSHSTTSFSGSLFKAYKSEMEKVVDQARVEVFNITEA